MKFFHIAFGLLLALPGCDALSQDTSGPVFKWHGEHGLVPQPGDTSKKLFALPGRAAKSVDGLPYLVYGADDNQILFAVLTDDTTINLYLGDLAGSALKPFCGPLPKTDVPFYLNAYVGAFGVVDGELGVYTSSEFMRCDATSVRQREKHMLDTEQKLQRPTLWLGETEGFWEFKGGSGFGLRFHKYDGSHETYPLSQEALFGYDPDRHLFRFFLVGSEAVTVETFDIAARAYLSPVIVVPGVPDGALITDLKFDPQGLLLTDNQGTRYASRFDDSREPIRIERPDTSAAESAELVFEISGNAVSFVDRHDLSTGEVTYETGVASHLGRFTRTGHLYTWDAASDYSIRYKLWDLTQSFDEASGLTIEFVAYSYELPPSEGPAPTVLALKDGSCMLRPVLNLTTTERLTGVDTNPADTSAGLDNVAPGTMKKVIGSNFAAWSQCGSAEYKLLARGDQGFANYDKGVPWLVRPLYVTKFGKRREVNSLATDGLINGWYQTLWSAWTVRDGAEVPVFHLAEAYFLRPDSLTNFVIYRDGALHLVNIE
jgi:hypothetical protein